MSEIASEMYAVPGGTIHVLKRGREAMQAATRYDPGRPPAERCALCGHPMVLEEIEMGDGEGRSGVPFTGYAEWWRCVDCGTFEVVQIPQ